MTGGFAFDEDITVARVISAREYGAIFVGETAAGAKVQVRYLGRDELPAVGDTFNVKGQWSTFTDRFRREQRQVETRVMKRKAVIGDLLAPFLQRVPNIGPQRADRLIQHYKHDLLEVLVDPTRVAEVANVLEPNKRALSMQIAAQLFAAMAEKSAADQVKLAEATFLVMLERAGLREPRIAKQLWRVCAGADANERLTRNPYLLAHFTSWKATDRVGRLLLRKGDPAADRADHPARLEGALANVWRELIADGDSAISEPALREMLDKRGVEPELALGHAEGIGKLRRRGALVRAPGAAWMEDEVARMLRAIEERPATVPLPQDKLLRELIKDGEQACDLRLTDEQAEALCSLIRRPLGVLQGGAGVGKTTVMKVLAYVWERQGGNVAFGALAGKAALQLSRGASSRLTPRLAHTLARMIGMLEQHVIYEDNPQNTPSPELQFDSKTLLVIDEAGMMDTPSFHHLLRLLPKGVRILLAGDDGQLFPVAFGRLFHDLVEEGSRVSTLTTVLRQAADSIIPLVAKQIRNGQTPRLSLWTGESKGVFLIDSGKLDDLVRDADFMLIAARRQTVEAWNQWETAKRRDDSTPTRRLGPLATVAVGDPIIITRNSYKHGLFNGLLGAVTDISGDRVYVHFDGEVVPRELPEESEADVELAYAITCHKSQGSSAATVVLLADDGTLVTREWLYTGITRGRELVLLSDGKASLATAVGRRTQRTCGFAMQ